MLSRLASARPRRKLERSCFKAESQLKTETQVSTGGVLISLPQAVSPQLDKPLKSVTHGQCDAGPTVTFPAAGYRRPLTGTKLYRLVTEAHVCEQLAQGCYTWKRTAVTRTRDLWSRKSSALTTTPPGHITVTSELLHSLVSLVSAVEKRLDGWLE